MKTLVTYWSQTGNTQAVAEAIYNVINGEKSLVPIDGVESLDGFDLTFIGFPVMQFGPPKPVKKFMELHAAGKRIALFILHAIPTGSDDPGQQVMLQKELEKCRASAAGSNLAGLFHCQGELSEKTALDLHASGIPMLMEFAAMRADTIGHPDAGELEEAGKFGRELTLTGSHHPDGVPPP